MFAVVAGGSRGSDRGQVDLGLPLAQLIHSAERRE